MEEAAKIMAALEAMEVVLSVDVAMNEDGFGRNRGN